MKALLLIVLLAVVFPGACTKARDPKAPLPPAQLEAAKQAKEQFERGNYREAEKIYEGILAAVPNNLYSLSNLGVVRFRSGKLKLAEEAFRQAIAVEPADGFSHCTLGIVYYSQARYDDAVNSLTKALAINPKNATAHQYLGIVAAQKGWHEAAQKELETAIKLDPSLDPSLHPDSNLGDFPTPLEKSRLELPSAKK